MLEFLQFVFADGWHFFGTAWLIWLVGRVPVKIARCFAEREHDGSILPMEQQHASLLRRLLGRA